MSIDRIVKLIAGTFILSSLVLAHYHSPYWLWVTAFSGANLFQAAFTGFCLPEIIHRRVTSDTQNA